MAKRKSLLEEVGGKPWEELSAAERWATLPKAWKQLIKKGGGALLEFGGQDPQIEKEFWGGASEAELGQLVPSLAKGRGARAVPAGAAPIAPAGTELGTPALKTVGETIAGAGDVENEAFLRHFAETGEAPEETARREFLERGGTIEGDPGLDPREDPSLPFETPFLPFGEQPAELGRDSLEGLALTGMEEDERGRREPTASDRRKQYARGLQQMGHGLGQWQQSIQSLSPQEGIGGMANFVGGYVNMITADARNSEAWGRFGTVLGIVGTWMNIRGQRESARRTANYRRDLTNSVALALRNAGGLG